MKIHHVRVTETEVHLGATTERRWRWELDDGAATAVNATDLVWVTLALGRAGAAVTETIGLFPDRASPERAEALRVIPALLAAAWRVLDEGWEPERASSELYGLELSEAEHTEPTPS